MEAGRWGNSILLAAASDLRPLRGERGGKHTKAREAQRAIAQFQATPNRITVNCKCE
jgi:hypothetical protein